MVTNGSQRKNFGGPLGRVPNGTDPQISFWEKVDKIGPVPTAKPELGPCWIWLTNINPNGYGQFTISKKTRFTHILAYEWIVGKVPFGLELDHLCRNRACCNPSHLEPVTRSENIRRGLLPGMVSKWLPKMVAKSAEVRLSRTVCRNGHAFTGEVDSKGHRICKQCIRSNQRRHAAKKREAAKR